MSAIEIFYISAIDFDDWKSPDDVRHVGGCLIRPLSTPPLPSHLRERQRPNWRLPVVGEIAHGENEKIGLTNILRPGHAFRKNAAGAFGPDLAKKLSQLVKMEKNAMRSMELVARERMEVAVCGWPRICDDRGDKLETDSVAIATTLYLG